MIFFCWLFRDRLLFHIALTTIFSISGGFAYVFVAQDTNTGKEYALKVFQTCSKTVCSTDSPVLNIHLTERKICLV